MRAALNKLKTLPKDKQNPDLLKKIHNTYLHHNKLLANLLEKKQQAEQALQTYMEHIFVAATEKAYQGVEMHIGDYFERTKREYGPSRMIYKERKVIIDPIIN